SRPRTYKLLPAVSTNPTFTTQAEEAGRSRSGVPAVEITNLRKSYGRTVALHDVNLTVEPGEVFGFLGANGAGKTTTVKILLGLVRPTSGRARIFGLPSASAEARRLLGYLPENFRFQDWLTGKELLELHCD